MSVGGGSAKIDAHTGDEKRGRNVPTLKPTKQNGGEHNVKQTQTYLKLTANDGNGPRAPTHQQRGRSFCYDKPIDNANTNSLTITLTRRAGLIFGDERVSPPDET